MLVGTPREGEGGPRALKRAWGVGLKGHAGQLELDCGGGCPGCRPARLLEDSAIELLGVNGDTAWQRDRHIPECSAAREPTWVEAPTHGTLAAVPGWPQQRGDDQGNDRHRQAGLSTHKLSEGDDRGGVAQTKQGRKQSVGDGANVQGPPVPVRVDYTLTSLGSSLLPVMQAIKRWAEDNIESVQFARAAYDTRNTDTVR
jgi:HxlR-like helix-turn-helix